MWKSAAYTCAPRVCVRLEDGAQEDEEEAGGRRKKIRNQFRFGFCFNNFYH